MVTIQIKKSATAAVTPTTGSAGAAGYDLYATEEYTLKPLERKLFKTGLSVAIPPGLYGRIAPRSGLAYKDGIDVMAGVIDSDYRGEIGVILINLGSADKKFVIGDKIAQIIFEHYMPVTFVEGSLEETNRGEGGFGSTDNKPAIDPKGKPPIKETVGINRNGKSLTELYMKAGGVQIQKPYAERIKERDRG